MCKLKVPGYHHMFWSDGEMGRNGLTTLVCPLFPSPWQMLTFLPLLFLFASISTFPSFSFFTIILLYHLQLFLLCLSPPPLLILISLLLLQFFQSPTGVRHCSLQFKNKLKFKTLETCTQRDHNLLLKMRKHEMCFLWLYLNSLLHLNLEKMVENN